MNFSSLKKIFWIKAILVFTILCSGVFNSVYSQHPSFYKLGEEELNGVNIYDLIQDNIGVYWLATNQGMFKFDGYTFQKVPSDDLLSNSLFELKMDYSNNIYCKNLSGQIFRVEKDTLKLFFSIPDSLQASNVHYDFDNKNSLIISSSVLLYKTLEGETEVLPYKNKSRIYIDGFFRLKDSSLIFYDTKANNFLYFKNGQLKIEAVEAQKEESFFHLHYLDNSPIFYESKSGLVYKKSGKTMLLDVKSETLHDNQLKLFHTDGENILLALYSGGVQVFNSDFEPLYGGEVVLKDVFISAFLKDKEGNEMLGTFGEGLVVISNSKLINLNFNNAKEHITKISSNSMNKIYLGTQSGKILEIDSMFQVTTIKSGLEKNIEVLEYIKEEDGILYDAKEPMVLDLVSGKSERKLFGSIKDVESVGNNDYIVGTNMGVYFFNSVTSISKPISSFNLRTYCANYNPNDNLIYAGTSKGLLIGNENHAEFIEIEGKTIKCNDIKYIKNQVFVATQNDGILVFKGKSLIDHWVLESGLISNSINQIKIHNGELFLGTSKGFQIVDQKGATRVIIGRSEGLGANNIIDFEIMNNRLWLVHQKGVQWINTKEFPKFDLIPSISISGMYLNDSLISDTGNLDFSYLENKISFLVRSNNLRYSSEISYDYKLEGIDKEWQTQTFYNNSISYKSLPSGNYEFKVKSVCRGIESELKTIAFSISQPFWFTWWFFAILLSLFLGITILIFRIQTKRHRKKVKLRNELNASKLIAIQSQMNPHFIFNAINSIQDLILKGDIDNSYSYIIKFSKLVRQTLNFSDKEFIDIEEEVELLEIYLELEKLRFSKDFEYSIVLENCDDLSVPPMLIQPLVENAIKHGLLHKKGEKKLNVKFIFNEKLTCIVEDDGIGREKANEIKQRQNKGHQSFSVSAMKNRFEIMQSQYKTDIGVKYIDLKDGGVILGTRVEINMPFRKKY